MRSKFRIYNKDAVYFVTSTIVNWIPLFNNEKYSEILINTIKHCQTHKSLILYAYVIMPDHFHMIISNDEISKLMQSIKKFTAKEIISKLTEDKNERVLEEFKKARPEHKITSIHQFWQESFHPQEMLNIEIMNKKIEYIHQNPVRKGLVEEAVDWKFSSAVDYYSDKKGLLEITKTF